MSTKDHVARLIPWYATGALDPSESAQVEMHLSVCDACRDLLAVARGFRRLAPQIDREVLFDHVQSQRLVEFAEDPSALEPDARRFITSHIQTCSTCAEALEILEDLGRASAANEPGATWTTARRRPLGKVWEAWMEIWRRLSRSILHPAPALAYLTALVVVLAVLPLRPPAPGTDTQPPAEGPAAQQPEARDGRQPAEGPGAGSPHAGSPPGPPVVFMPPASELPGEVVFRGVGRPPAPVAIPLRAGADRVALALITDIDPEDLQDAGAAFHLEIVQGDRLIFEALRRGSDFDRRGRLTLLLDPAAVSAGVPCRVRILLVKAGDPRDREEVYGRSFLLAPDGASLR